MNRLDEIKIIREQCTALSSTNLKYVLAVVTALKFTEDTTADKSSTDHLIWHKQEEYP